MEEFIKEMEKEEKVETLSTIIGKFIGWCIGTFIKVFVIFKAWCLLVTIFSLPMLTFWQVFLLYFGVRFLFLPTKEK